MEGANAVVAVDVGGTKLATAVVDCHGSIHAARKTAVSKAGIHDSVEQIIDEANCAVEASGIRWDKIRGAGVIVPGIYHAKEGTAWAPNLWGDADVPLLPMLSSRLPVPVLIDSDRAGCVLGEQWLGVARGLTDVVFVAVGTGIGAGILSGGRLLRGAGDSAGAVGWFALNPCFHEIYAQTGCWEAEASGSAVARHAGETSAEHVAEAARRGDALALRALERAASYLAMGVANLISAFNPQMVVLGGGLMQAGDLLLDPIRRAVPRWAQPRAASQVRIELTQLGGRAGLLGAAKLALSK
jgi:glucokinase